MAKVLLLLGAFGLLFVSAIASSIPEPFVVEGKVMCDYCRVGYEVNPIRYLGGSTVELKCKTRADNTQVYSKEAVTRPDGSYRITVERDFGDHLCMVSPVKSSDADCSSRCPGRDGAQVTLTRGNGMADNVRHANTLAFTRKTPLASCVQLLQQYVDLESTD